MNEQAQYHIIHDRCGHEVSGTFDRNVVEHRDDLCPSCQYPRPTTEPPAYWRGATPGLDSDEVVALIRERGPLAVASLIAGAGIATAMLVDGLDLIRWTVRQSAGCIVFARLGDDDKPNAPVIACVNAPESDCWRWQDELGPDVVVVMQPQGQQRYQDVSAGPF